MATKQSSAADVPINSEGLDPITHWFNVVTVFSGFILETSCLILFAYHFIKKSPPFCSQYFYLLFIGYLIAVSTLTFSVLEILLNYRNIFMVINLIAEWYFSLFLGPWNTVLAINRSTAILFWQKHPTIWSSWRFFGIITVTLAYPAIGTFIVVWSQRECFLDMQYCEEMFDEFDNFKVISNAISIGISVAFGIATVGCLRFKIIQISRDTKDMEIHLFLQSIISLLFFGIYFVYGIIFGNLYDENDIKKAEMNSILYTVLFAMSKFYLLYYHMSSTLLLFCLSNTVRQSYIEFYSCNQIKVMKKPPPIRVTVIKTATTLN